MDALFTTFTLPMQSLIQQTRPFWWISVVRVMMVPR